MSWLFSRVLVEEYSGEKFSGGEPCAPLSVMPSPRPFLCSDKTMDFSPPSPFGLTLKPLTASRGEALLKSYLAAFPAKTSAQPGAVQGLTASDPDSGWKWPASFVKYDLASRSWRTRQCSLLGDLEPFSEIWPRWGSMLDGECLALPTPARPTFESESGSLPTPRSTDGDRGGRGDLIQAVRGNPNSHYKLWQTPVADDSVDRVAGKVNSRVEPKLSAQVKMLPTPNSRDWKDSGPTQGNRKSPNLGVVVHWPTPHGFSKDGRSNGPSGNELGRAVNRTFPTPVSTSATGDRKGLDGGSHARQRLLGGHRGGMN